MASIYLNAALAKYNNDLEDTSLNSTGSFYAFQDLSVVRSSVSLDDVDYINLVRDQFLKQLSKGNFNLQESYEVAPVRDVSFYLLDKDNFDLQESNDVGVSLDRLYIKLNDNDSGDCILASDPFATLVKATTSKSGKFYKFVNAGEPSHDFQAQRYEGVYYRNLTYSFPNNDHSEVEFSPVEDNADFPIDTLYISYHKCIVESIRFEIVDEQTISLNLDRGIPNVFYKNLLILEEHQRTYIENFKDKLFYDDVRGVYRSDISRDLAHIRVVPMFFPTLVLNYNRVIHGEITQALIEDLASIDPSADFTIQADFYAKLCIDTTHIADYNTMRCSYLSEDGTVAQNGNWGAGDGLVSVSHNGAFYSFADMEVCPVRGFPATVMALIRQPSVPLYSYKSFTDCYVNIYAYNFKNIDYVDANGIHTPFITNQTVQSSTVVLKAHPLDLSKFVSANFGFAEIVRLIFKFKTYKNTASDVDALNHSLIVDMRIYRPSLYSPQIKGNIFTIKTSYATHVKYNFNSDPRTSVTVEADTTGDGSGQLTEIDITGKSGFISLTAYNYFARFGNYKRVYEVTENFNLAPVIYEHLVISSFELKLYGDGNILPFRDDADPAKALMNSLNITDCTQSSFSDYSVASSRLVEYYQFQLSFTLAVEGSQIWLKIANFDSKRIYSGEMSRSVTRSELLQQVDGLGRFNIQAFLDNVTPFIVPFTLSLYSNSDENSIPAGAITKPLTITFTSFLFAEFSFNYKRAIEIEYEILNQNDIVIYGPVLEKVTYSENFVEKTVKANELPMGNLTNLTAKIKMIYRTSTYPHPKSFIELTTSAVTNNFKILSSYVPGLIKFYSDEAMTTLATNVVRGLPIYAFLQLYDHNNTEILVNNYLDYIHPAPNNNSIFEIVESLDDNVDLDAGVILTKKSAYSCSFIINASSSFDDLDLILNAVFDSRL